MLTRAFQEKTRIKNTENELKYRKTKLNSFFIFVLLTNIRDSETAPHTKKGRTNNFRNKTKSIEASLEAPRYKFVPLIQLIVLRSVKGFSKEMNTALLYFINYT
jgi:hypothetical protein